VKVSTCQLNVNGTGSREQFDGTHVRSVGDRVILFAAKGEVRVGDRHIVLRGQIQIRARSSCSDFPLLYWVVDWTASLNLKCAE
jgi:hypothetical protein